MQRTREDREQPDTRSSGISSLVHTFKGDKKGSDDGIVTDARVVEEEDEQVAGLSERDVELVNARRVLRQARWASVFYLITCDM